jgi:hypothetical protein
VWLHALINRNNKRSSNKARHDHCCNTHRRNKYKSTIFLGPFLQQRLIEVQLVRSDPMRFEVEIPIFPRLIGRRSDIPPSHTLDVLQESLALL